MPLSKKYILMEVHPEMKILSYSSYYCVIPNFYGFFSLFCETQNIFWKIFCLLFVHILKVNEVQKGQS